MTKTTWEHEAHGKKYSIAQNEQLIFITFVSNRIARQKSIRMRADCGCWHLKNHHRQRRCCHIELINVNSGED